MLKFTAMEKRQLGGGGGDFLCLTAFTSSRTVFPRTNYGLAASVQQEMVTPPGLLIMRALPWSRDLDLVPLQSTRRAAQPTIRTYDCRELKRRQIKLRYPAAQVPRTNEKLGY